jgi:anti-sigma-K factor RskA
MNIPDETLMAFVDGELDAAARAAVESALKEDPELAKRVARHVALRQRLRVAYSSELTEPVPQRLLEAAKRVPPQANNIVSLKDARGAKLREAADSSPSAVRWRPAAAIAASVIIGFGLGYANRNQGSAPLVRTADGALTAGGALAKALSTQLVARQNPGSEVHIGVSYKAKNGEYCRTFALSGTVSPSGLACRYGEQWRIESLGQSNDAAGSGYRTAGTNMSSQTLKAVEERIDGEALDAAGEAEALQKDWRK